MKQIKVIRNGQVTNILPYNTEADIAHFQSHVDMGTFGKPSQVIRQETIPAVILEDGTELVPAGYELVTVPGDFETEIVDNTAKLEQEKINAEALAYLAATDYLIIRELDSGVPCPAEVKAERQAARQRIVK